ncbi:MAG: beta-galactosidase [Actinomycetaceae bacterium]|nr:beta-galactosidase [Actinomycetaceae bacterium]
MLSNFSNKIYYGGDYNPEQWDDKIIADDIQHMQEARVNLVSLGIFAWSVIEPESESYRFEWLDRVLDQLEQAEICVDMATGTASPPSWLIKKHSEILPVDHHGRRLQFGSRQHFAPSSKTYRKYAARFVDVLSSHVKDRSNIILWHVNNEYGAHVPMSYDSITIESFHTWLEERYRTIAKLNEAWNTRVWSQWYGAFSDIGAPHLLPTFPHPAHVQDWQRFCNDMLLECYKTEVAVLRKNTPHIPITTNFMGAFPPTNYWDWAQHVDIISDDSYPDPADRFGAAHVAFVSDLSRSLKPESPFILMEQTPDVIQWRDANSPKRPQQHRLWSISRLARGANSIMQFQWRQGTSGAETFHGGMLPHCIESPTWEETKDLGKTLSNLNSIANEKNMRGDVGIVLDWENIWASESLLTSAPFSHLTAVKQWHQSLWENSIHTDIVSPTSDFSRYTLIIVPQSPICSHELITNLEKAQKQGSHVLFTAPCNIVDKNMSAILGGYAKDIAHLCGVRAVQHCCSTYADKKPTIQKLSIETNRITAAVPTYGVGHIEIDASKELPIIGSDHLHGHHWGERLIVDSSDVDIFARFSDSGAIPDLGGLPALTCHQPGLSGGDVWYLATDANESFRQSIVMLLVDKADIPCPGTELPAGIEYVRRGNCHFFFNHSSREITLQASRSKNGLFTNIINEPIAIAARDFAVINYS